MAGNENSGRPSLYTEEIAKEIEERLSNGETLRSITKDNHLPAWQSVYRWMNSDADFSRRIAAAREVGHDAIAEQCFDIADQSAPDYSFDPERGLVVNGEHIQRQKLRIETRTKLLAKWNPKKYGDSTTIKGDKDNPLNSVSASDQVLKMLTLDQLEDLRIKIIEREHD